MSNSNHLDVSVLRKWFYFYLLTICLQRAIELVEKAIFEDVKHNYAEAYKIYQNALDYFMLAHKCEWDPTASRGKANLLI